jgi:polysaccharide export outer membrane protein
MSQLRKWCSLAALAVACAAMLGGCTVPGGTLPAAGADVPASGEYVIGPGDQLNIVVWRNVDLSHAVPVRPDGKITTPLVEDMSAVGKTPTQLARDIESALSKYVRDPVVTVVVTSFLPGQIRVIGEAEKPQAVTYRKNMTLLDVMVAVGGMSKAAAGNRTTLLRVANRERFNVRLDDLLKRGDLSANVEVRPGDVILIPEAVF